MQRSERQCSDKSIGSLLVVQSSVSRKKVAQDLGARPFVEAKIKKFIQLQLFR